MDSKYKRLFKNTFLIMLGGSLSKVVTLLMLPFYTQWLSVEDYGVSDVIVVYASLFAGISTLCVTEGLFLFSKGANFEKQKKYFSSSVFFTLILLVILAFIFYIVHWFSTRNESENLFTTYIGFIYAIVVTTFFQTLTQQFACSINAMTVYSFTGIVYSITLAATAFMFVPQYGISGYVYSMILANVIAICYTFFATCSYRYLSIHCIKLSSYQELIRYSIPLIPNALMFWIVSSVNRPFLESFVGVAAIGLLAFANKFPAVLSLVFNYFAQSWQVSVCEEYRNRDFVPFFNRIMKSVYFLLVLLACVITICSRQILYVITSPDFYDAAIYIGPLCFGIVLSSMSGMMGGIFGVNKKSKYFFYTSIIGASSSLLMNFCLIPLFGLWGAVFASILSYLSICVARLFLVRKFVKIYDIDYYLVMMACFSLVALTNYLLVNFWLNLLVLIVIFILLMVKKDIRIGVVRVSHIAFRKILQK